MDPAHPLRVLIDLARHLVWCAVHRQAGWTAAAGRRVGFPAGAGGSGMGLLARIHGASADQPLGAAVRHVPAEQLPFWRPALREAVEDVSACAPRTDAPMTARHSERTRRCPNTAP